MINPWCPPDLESNKKYVAREKYINAYKKNNSIFKSAEEKKLDHYYTQIIKRKLSQLKYKHTLDIKILDICAGYGFTTYHISKIFGQKNKYYLIDINKNEIKDAKTLLKTGAIFWTGDFLSYVFNTKFDLIIGNSFLHHFSNVPYAINKIYRLLKNNGHFIDLHEPSEKAAFIESVGRDNIIETAKLLNIRGRGQKAIGCDLWMFNHNDLKNLLEKTGFKKIKIYKSGFLRTIFETLFKYSSRKKINPPLRAFLNIFYKIDSIILNNFEFPFFSSYFFTAQKK